MLKPNKLHRSSKSINKYRCHYNVQSTYSALIYSCYPIKLKVKWMYYLVKVSLKENTAFVLLKCII
jgi:hypothetical protein